MWLSTLALAATTYHVGAGDSLQAAVAGAAAGDVIEIDPITVTTDLPPRLDKAVTIRGAGAGATVLALPARIIGQPSIEIVEDVTLQDLTLDGQDATSLLWVKNHQLTLDRVVLQNAVDAVASGGGIRVEEPGRVSATDVTFQDLSVKEGGGVFLVGHSTLDCLRCTFQRDAATGPQGDGGAVWVDSGTATLTDATVTGNRSENWLGGAVSVNGGKGVVHVLGGEYRDNHAATRGGAISVRAGAELTVGPSVTSVPAFSGNVADGDGGAIACDGPTICTVTIAGATFSGDLADGSGGGLFAQDGLVIVSDTTFSGESAGADGGAVAVQVGELDVTRALWCDNRAGGAGGAVSAGSATTITNVAALRNRAGASGGVLDVGIGEVTYASLVDNDGQPVSALTASLAYSLGASVLAEGSNAVVGIVQIRDGATWNVTRPYGKGTLVSSSITLDHDPFDLPKAFCGYPIPEFGGPLVDQRDTDEDPDGSDADLGSTGGPDADPALWADNDADGIVAMWDCDDSDPTVGYVDGCAPDVTTGPPAGTTPPATSPPTGDPGDRPASAEDDAIGCGCESTGSHQWMGLLGLTAIARRRRSARRS